VISVTQPRQLAIVGRGRLGTALARRAVRVGHTVTGPLARDYPPAQLDGVEMVLLCVPDREIPAAASAIDGRCPLVGHCSGASTLDALLGIPAAARFSLHPLMTFSGITDPEWDGAGAAIAGLTPAARASASDLARELGLLPFEVAETDRAAYHAAASVASNFLITLELAAERLAATAGVGREALLPLVRATVENWGRDGAAALTGPIARRDTATVLRQREAVAERTPELLRLFDTLAEATRELASEPGHGPASEMLPAPSREAIPA
jgi:predicted short-subunit dehydrogenase-like oxidoreductase (DUF2520 family)